jgi:hypothetical protein
MAPDQTTRLKENKFDIYDGYHFRWKFLTISKFSDYIPFLKDGNPQCFEDFRLYSLFKGWKSPTFRSFLIIFPFHRMEISNVSKISDYIPFLKNGNPHRFEDFGLYSLFKGWKSPTFRSFPIIFPFHRMEISNILKFSDYKIFGD